MAFKSVEEFNEELYHGKFRLVNNGDTADVVFLYRSKRDELRVDAHYVNSADYSGYVHCLGKGCPACAKGLRVQHKLFIPLYVIKQNDALVNKILFWDRNVPFYKRLDQAVFNNYENPSDYIFKIIRKGEAGDKETIFDITATNRNSIGSYDSILAKFNATMPDYYSEVIREYTSSELASLLKNEGSSPASDLPDYMPIPRAGYQPSIPDTYVDAAGVVGSEESAPEDLPPMGGVPTIDATETSLDLPDVDDILNDAADIDSGDGDLATPDF